jgi:hypothetical protein
MLPYPADGSNPLFLPFPFFQFTPKASELHSLALKHGHQLFNYHYNIKNMFPVQRPVEPSIFLQDYFSNDKHVKEHVIFEFS